MCHLCVFHCTCAISVHVAESDRFKEFEAHTSFEKTNKTFVLTQRARLSDSERRAGTRQLWRPCERQNAAQAAHYYREIASVRKLRSRNSNPASPVLTCESQLRLALRVSRKPSRPPFQAFSSPTGASARALQRSTPNSQNILPLDSSYLSDSATHGQINRHRQNHEDR